ncbi:UDP-N-acetylmuramoyl-L-alanine--D-glutamate ligase [Stratiformator vulcanicus]|nr:UDP-N-acetylmuramoyl-L-alanine--D-glutamate ligase [Stratiformator vulcanicus]
MSSTYHGCRITVMGLGRFGGGTAAARYLADHGARVTVTDLRTEAELADELAALDDVPLEGIHVGGHRENDFVNTDMVVVSPAVAPSSPFLKMASFANVRLSSEIELFWNAKRSPIIGVTGTVGKSSTATLIADMLRAGGLGGHLGGNIGHSLLGEVDDIKPEDWVVLELSSFQLHGLRRLKVSPEIAVVTNFVPNHLNWHRTVEHYRQSKQTILAYQTPNDAAVLNADDLDVSRWETLGNRLTFSGGPSTQSTAIVKNGEIKLSHQEVSTSLTLPPTLDSPHQSQNAAAAATAALAAGVDIDAIATGLREFAPLPHRLEQVGQTLGRTFVDDSKSTTPRATVAAVEATPKPLRLIVGGADGDIDLRPLVDAAARSSVAIYLIGQTAIQIETLLRDFAPQARTIRCSTLRAAVLRAWGESRNGDTILLSPGCPSYGEFQDYRDRGMTFRECVADIAAEDSAQAA